MTTSPKLKAGKHTAGLVMHTMDAGWPHLQVAGITNTLKDYGIEVIGATDAKFNVGQQISDLEQMIARKPDVIFSIPIDPKSEFEAYKKAAAAGIKLVFLDNVPVNMAPGKDYVSVVAADNEKNAFFAADELAKAIGGKGEVGILTLVYDYYYSSQARKDRGAQRPSLNIRTSRSSRSARSPRPKRPIRWRRACSPPIRT